VLFFDPAGTEPAPGQSVIVQTERGTELGQVVDVPGEVSASESAGTLKPVERIATADDLALADELAEKEREAMGVYRQLIEEYKLDMKPVDVEFLFGGDKVVFYFVAEERVDFRELVRELASRFKSRIDMRQVGVRDEARMVGGLGHCGQPLCCVRFSGDFQPVSIRMAKEQDLPLNPLKISGLCGRLMCCLRYEFDAYKDYKSRAPKRGARIETPVGEGKVSGLNTPRETVDIRLAEGGTVTVPLEALECSSAGGRPCRLSAEALEAATGATATNVLSGPIPELTESGAGSTKSEKDAPAGEKRRPRRKSKGGGTQQQTSGGSQPAAQRGQPQQAGEQQANSGSTGRRRRRRRPTPKKDGSTGT
jgi:cell fate regulator YaaT (PSP1 superfamily)